MTEPTKIRRLAKAPKEPDTEIIAMLESALARARQGELVDCVIVCSSADGYERDYKINSDGFAITGFMLRVQHDIIADHSGE